MKNCASSGEYHRGDEASLVRKLNRMSDKQLGTDLTTLLPGPIRRAANGESCQSIIPSVPTRRIKSTFTSTGRVDKLTRNGSHVKYFTRVSRAKVWRISTGRGYGQVQVTPSFLLDKAYYTFRAHKPVVSASASIITLILTLAYPWVPILTSTPHYNVIREVTLSAEYNRAVNLSPTASISKIDTMATLVVTVSQLKNLSRISRSVDSILIREVESGMVIPGTEENDGDNFQISPKVKMPHVQARISWTTLVGLINSFPNLAHLSINLEDNCKVGFDFECLVRKVSLPTDTVHQELGLESLTLTNGKEGCTMLERLLNLKLPLLQKLTIHDTLINQVGCRALEEFFRQASPSLSHILIDRSHLSDCDFRELDEPQLPLKLTE